MARSTSLSNIFVFSLSVIYLGVSLASGKPHAPLLPRHSSLNLRGIGSQNASSVGRRGTGAKFTHYAVGLGACGKFNTPDQYVVALNPQDWENGKHCFEMITITINGQATEAQVVDFCAEGCIPGQVDMSNGLFERYAPLPSGALYGDWFFGSAPTSTSTSSAQPTSTSTISSSSTTSTSSFTSSTPASTSTSASRSTTSSTGSSSPATSSSTSTPSSTQPSNVNNLDQFVLRMGNIIVNGGQVSQSTLVDN